MKDNKTNYKTKPDNLVLALFNYSRKYHQLMNYLLCVEVHNIYYITLNETSTFTKSF